MKVSLNWVKEFVEAPVEPRQLKDDLSKIGLNVESVEQEGDDWIFDIEITTNRPDCLSHYGVAREVSTLYGKALKRVEVVVRESQSPVLEAASIEIADPDLCARYCGRVIQAVQVRPSPTWMKKRLEAVGQRPINNVADATNYVLMELGHPLHAFDLARLRGHKIIVRRARAGERLGTLDGTERTLQQENLVIADAERAVALAGVMGGEDTEISPATRSVLLESAWFEPTSIRRTAKVQGLHTEASHRFERGADIEMAPLALDRAAALIAELTGGEVLLGMVDVYPPSTARRARGSIFLGQRGIKRLLGTEIADEEVERILRSLGFQVERREPEGWQVTPPTFRLDVALEVDLIEEIARHYGYDRLPARVRPATLGVEGDASREKVRTATAILTALGYHEIMTPSMGDPAENSRFTDRPPVPLANPQSQEASAMRSTAAPSMIRALRWNLDRGQTNLRFFELGKIYGLKPSGESDEPAVLTLGATGLRGSTSVQELGRPLDFFDLKGDLESLLKAFDSPKLHFEPRGCKTYTPGLSGTFLAGESALAVFGRLSPGIAEEYKLRQPVWLAEVDFQRLLETPLAPRTYRPYSKFPAVERDFSLVVPETISYSRLEESLRSVPLKEIQNYGPVDLFRGGAIPKGYYSLLLRVTFQSHERTLTSEEIGEASQRLLRVLEPLGVRVRK